MFAEEEKAREITQKDPRAFRSIVKILSGLEAHGGAARFKELRKWTSLDAATLAKHLRALREEELTEKKGEKRTAPWSLTWKGRQTYLALNSANLEPQIGEEIKNRPIATISAETSTWRERAEEIGGEAFPRGAGTVVVDLEWPCYQAPAEVEGLQKDLVRAIEVVAEEWREKGLYISKLRLAQDFEMDG